MKGTRLGSYRLLEELGAGGTATVYLARVEGPASELAPGDLAAVKVIHPHLLKTRGYYDRLVREVELGRSVRHENVVRTIELGQVEIEGETVRYFVMEYVKGQTLRDLLLELGWCPEGLCRHIATEVATALAAVHAAGIIHRDVKPENVLITRDEVVKIMDLGVARLRDEALRLSQPGQFVGTLLYAAPEQISPAHAEIDGRTDLYALGVTLYELATGRHPFGGEEAGEVIQGHLRETPCPPSERNPQISPFFEELVLTLLEKKPAERFPSANSLVTALEGGRNSDWWRSRSRRIRSETRRPLRRVRIPRETPLYGRDTEFRILGELWDRVRAGEGRVVIVEGEAGIGKSRLADDFVAGLSRKGVKLNYLFGAYSPGGAATAAGAFSTAFREHLGREGLESKLRDGLGVPAALAPALAAILMGGPAPPGLLDLTRDVIETGFIEATRALAKSRPSVLLVDDLHEAPEEGRALFAALAHSIGEDRVLLAGTARPGLSEEWRAAIERLPHVSFLRLGRLGPRDIQRLLVDVLSSKSLAEELWPEVARKSDGNPFFIFEIVRALRENHQIRESGDGSWVRTGDVCEVSIPDSVKVLVQARISALDEEDRDLLDVAACSGFEFDPVLVAEALERGRIPTLKRFTHVQRAHRLVHAAGRRFVFDHHQVQEALIESLSAPLREEYHLALAEALEQRRPDGAEIDPSLAVEICDHLLRAGQGNRARTHLDAALKHLEGGYLHTQAEGLAGRALAVEDLYTGAERVNLLLRRGGHLNVLGHWKQQRAVAVEALEIAEEIGDPRLEMLAIVQLEPHQHPPAGDHRTKAVLRRALKHARAEGDKLSEARALGYLGMHHGRAGRLHAAVRRFRRQRDLAEEIGDDKLVARTEGNLSHQYWRQGRHEESFKWAHRSLDHMRKLGDRLGESRIACILGAWYYDFGRYDAAREQFERQLELSRDIGYRKGELMAALNIGLVLKCVGRFAEAMERFRADIETCTRMGNLTDAAISRGHLASLLTATGVFDEAHRLWEESLEAFRAGGDCWWEAYGVLWRGRVFEEEGRLAEAEEWYRRAMDLLLAQENRTALVEAHLFLGRVLLLLGREEEARESLVKAVDQGEEMGLPSGTLVAASWLAVLPGEDPGRALDLLARHEASTDLTERMEARFALYRALDDPVHLDEAYRLLEEIRVHAPPEHRTAMLTRVPLYRGILEAWEERSQR